MFVGALAWSAAAAPVATAAEADLTSLSLEDLGNLKVNMVYGASEHEQKTTEAPSSVTIITADEIRGYGYRTLADILNSVRGFYVNYDRVYSFIGVRGFNEPSDFGGRVLVMVDGHRINDPIYDQAFSGTEGVVDVDMIERVEIIRGPGSSLYGNNAFFAVINIITKRGNDLDGGEASGSYASYDTYQTRLSYGKQFKGGVEFLVSGTYANSAGHPQLYFPEFSTINNGEAENLDGMQLGTLLVSASYRDFLLEGGFMARSKDVPSAAYGSVFNQPENAYDQRSFADLKYQHLFDGGLQVMTRLYYDHYRYDGSYTLDYMDPANPGLTQNRDFNYAQSLGLEVQAQKTLWEKNTLTLGVDYQHDLDIVLRNVDLNPPVTYLDSDHMPDRVGLYVQDEWAICTNLSVNAGARYDYYTTFGDTINPRVGLIYQPLPATTLKALYGTAYHAPNANDLYDNTGIYETNPNLRPETIRSYELDWEQGIGQHLRSTVAVYYNQIRDLITLQVDPNNGLYTYENTDSVDSYGIETELEGHWAHGWQGRVSYALQQTKNNLTDQTLPNSPTHLAKFNLLMPIVGEKLSAGLEVQAMSARLTERGTSVDGFGIVNVTLLSRDTDQNLEISASVYNLLDTNILRPGFS